MMKLWHLHSGSMMTALLLLMFIDMLHWSLANGCGRQSSMRGASVEEATSSERELTDGNQDIFYHLFRHRYRPNQLSYLLASQKMSLLHKQCFLVILNITFDNWEISNETSWMITLGDTEGIAEKHPPYYDIGTENDGSDNGEGTIVAFSHKQYLNIDYESHAFCLPGKGIYTFTIFDWGGNGLASEEVQGTYALYSQNGQSIFQYGGNFGYIQSTVFELPLPPLPSNAPSASSSPTISSSPTMDCTFITVEISYDMYPQQTTWMVIKGGYEELSSGNIVKVAESTESSGGIVKTQVCLPGEGQYSFVISDFGADGICCVFGEGYYVITSPTLPDEVIAQGGNFQSLDIATFDVPLVIAPSMSPTTSPIPTASHAPSVDCAYIEIRLMFDVAPSENSWSITQESDGKVIVQSEYYDDWAYGGVYTILSYCLPGDGIYTFAIEDLSGNGMCCTLGSGSYMVVYRGDNGEETVAEGGEFEYEEVTTFSIPYNTLAPTISPAPSILCYNVEVSLTFDPYPFETSWLIISGEMEELYQNSNWLSFSVAESSKYGFGFGNTTVMKVECLPVGVYTFVIIDSDGICCDYGDGEYSVTILNGNGMKDVIKQGGEFTTFESVTFILPYVPGSIPTSQSTANSPTSGYWIDIDLKFDSAPYEVEWVVCSGTDNCLLNEQANIIEQSKYYSMFYNSSEESQRVYLTDGQYTFFITDTKGNGLCCSFGNGYYQVSLHDASGDTVIGQGSDFGAGDSVTFTVPREGGGSFHPTPSPVQSVRKTPVPTVDGCTQVQINILFDVFPWEVHWWLITGDFKSFENGRQEFIDTSPFPSYNAERFDNVTHTYCLGEGKYSFIIFDDGVNGICCEFGRGSFVLSYGDDEEIFAKGGQFGFFDMVQFEVPFPTRSPTWTPPPTTQTPTTSIPTPLPTYTTTTPLNCSTLLDVTTHTDGDQSEIRWEVFLGGQSSTDNNLALIVAQSEDAMYQIAEYKLRTSDSDSVCLPGEGEYTFTIFDGNSGGDSNYTLYVDEVLIASKNKFGFSDSTTFSVPVMLPPTPAPQSGSISLSPADCTMIQITITFDEFVDETYWQLFAGDADEIENSIAVAESPFYNSQEFNSTVTHQVCLPGDGTYTFAIYDISMDGICCQFGNGGYIVESMDEPSIIIVEGGQFLESEITSFLVPIVSAPSMSPTATYHPTVSSAPTAECSQVEISITFDQYPDETVWSLSLSDTNVTVAQSPYYPSTEFAQSTTSELVCLSDGSYTFLITDERQDGNCCRGYGDGKYSITYKGDTGDLVIVDKGPDPSFLYYDSISFTIPYIIPPTMSPTTTPPPTSSLAPTNRCIPIEVVINFDAYPEDIVWDITIGNESSVDNNSAVKVAESPLYDQRQKFSTNIHPVCLPAEGQYTFTVYAGKGNGMCCLDGTGGYILLSIDDNENRQIVAEGAVFEWNDIVSFDLPLVFDPRKQTFS